MTINKNNEGPPSPCLVRDRYDDRRIGSDWVASNKWNLARARHSQTEKQNGIGWSVLEEKSFCGKYFQIDGKTRIFGIFIIYDNLEGISKISQKMKARKFGSFGGDIDISQQEIFAVSSIVRDLASHLTRGQNRRKNAARTKKTKLRVVNSSILSDFLDGDRPIFQISQRRR